MGDVLEQVAAVADQMVQYNLHREELLLLQATVLVNAGTIIIVSNMSLAKGCNLKISNYMYMHKEQNSQICILK